MFFIIVFIISMILMITAIFAEIEELFPIAIIGILIGLGGLVFDIAGFNDDVIKNKYDEIVLQYKLDGKGFEYDPDESVKELEDRVLPFLKQYNDHIRQNTTIPDLKLKGVEQTMRDINLERELELNHGSKAIKDPYLYYKIDW